MIKEKNNKHDSGEIYDAIYDLPENYLKFILFFLGNSKTTLELGVGTGRISIPVAKNGYTLYGIDNDVNMLEKCKEKILLNNLENKIFIFKRDITKFQLNVKVNTCFFTSDTYMLINKIEDRLKSLINCSKHLEKNGKLLIILNNPCKCMNKKYERTLHKNGTLKDGSKLKISEYRKVDLVKWERIGFDEYSFLDTNKKMSLPISHGIVTQSEIELLAYLSGLSIIQTYGNYQKGPLTQSSEKAIYILKKIKEIN